jgi:DNA-binding response OmpR family regulator
MASDNHTVAQTKSRMLLALWRAPGRPLAFSELARRSGCSSSPGTQRVHVCRLRKCLPEGSIDTAVGVGWRLTEIGRAAVDEAFHDLVRVVLAAVEASPRAA